MNEEISQNLEDKKAQVDNSCINEKSYDINALESIRNYTLKSLRELIFLIKTSSRGKIKSNQAISRHCGWDKSRLNQVLGNFQKFFPKTKEKRAEFWKKLTDTLESVSGKNTKGDVKNGANSED